MALRPGRPFGDTRPGFCAVAGANDLGQCLPIATPDTTTFPGSDFYRIGVTEYSRQLHADLPPTKLRGYVQLDATSTPVYAVPAALGRRRRRRRGPRRRRRRAAHGAAPARRQVAPSPAPG